MKESLNRGEIPSEHRCERGMAMLGNGLRRQRELGLVVHQAEDRHRNSDLPARTH